MAKQQVVRTTVRPTLPVHPASIGIRRPEVVLGTAPAIPAVTVAGLIRVSPAVPLRPDVRGRIMPVPRPEFTEHLVLPVSTGTGPLA